MAEGITFGSFHLTRLAFLNPTASDVTLGLLGAGQLLIEFATVVRCLCFIDRLRRSGRPGPRIEQARGARRADSDVWRSMPPSASWCS